MVSYERCSEQCMCTSLVLLYFVYIIGLMVLLHIVNLYWPSFVYITKTRNYSMIAESSFTHSIFSVLYGQC